TLRADGVLWFGAEERVVFAETERVRHYVNFTLDQLEQRLDPRRFARVHRSAIANLDWAAALRPGFAGTYRLQLRDAARTEGPVSRIRARALRRRLRAPPPGAPAASAGGGPFVISSEGTGRNARRYSNIVTMRSSVPIISRLSSTV